MANLYVKQPSGTIGSGTFRGIFQPSVTYAVGDRVVATSTGISNHVYECTVGGLAGAEPAWSTSLGTPSTTGAVTFMPRRPESWADAQINLHRVFLSDAAGDTIYVDSALTNSISSAVESITMNGTLVAPNKVISVLADSSPVTYQAATAQITTNNSTGFSFSGKGVFDGLSFKNSASTVPLLTLPSDQTATTFKNCAFQNSGSATTMLIAMNTSTTTNEGNVKFANCTFNAVGNRLIASTGSFVVAFESCALTLAGASSFLVDASGNQRTLFANCDLTGMLTGQSVINPSTATGAVGQIDLVNCAFPSGWTQNIGTRPAMPSFFVRLSNCKAGATDIPYKKFTGMGDIDLSTGTYKNSGSTEGAANASWRFITTSNASDIGILESDMIALPIDTAGTYTITVDIAGTATLTNADIWLEIDYRDGFVSTQRQNIATPTNHATSSATWTDSSATLTTFQKLEASITTTSAGNAYIKVCLAKISTTVYVDYKAVAS